MPTLTSYLLVGAGGFLGAIARYVVTLGVSNAVRSPFPFATFLINVSGSFLIGVIGVLVARRMTASPEAVRLALAVGFLGAFTTFSAFEAETDWMLRDGRWGLGLGYVTASVVAGLLAVRAGAAIGNAL
ncbi:MAG: fluoride efflux transporter CrcB [Vicinamibacterales bacterium]